MSIKVNQSGNWKTIASGNAKGISTSNPDLLNAGETDISVYDAIERIAKEQKKHKGYIAWLAKNGGGGSGSGGGTTITEATCTITVQGTEDKPQPTGNKIIMGSSGLIITLTNLQAALTKSWTITVRAGSALVLTTSASTVNNQIFIDSSKITPYLTNHTNTLSINASYIDDTKGIYGSSNWNGSVVENSVVISTADISSTVEDMPNAQMIVNYSVGYLGDSSVANYRLILSMIKDGETVPVTYQQDLTITTTSQQTSILHLKSALFSSISDDNMVGVYTITATLVSITDSSIASSSVSTITVASDAILVSSTKMVKWDDNNKTPGHYSQISVEGNINLIFTAYVQSLTNYKYSVYINSISNDNILRSNVTGYFGTQVNDPISVAGKSWAVAGNINKLILVITSADKSITVEYGLEFVSSVNKLLNERNVSINNLTNEFIAREHLGEPVNGTDIIQYENNSYVNGSVHYSITSKMSFINNNYLSKVVVDKNNTPYLRLSNGAGVKIGSWSYGSIVNTGLENLVKAGGNFTISLCFKADYHADDSRTILSCGNVDPTSLNMTNNGISIDVHGIYIGTQLVARLTDNTVNDVNIVCEKTSYTKPDGNGGTEQVTEYILKVYVDGVMSSVNDLGSTFPTIGDTIYLGCRMIKSSGEETYFNLCDCDIYTVKVYDKVLTDYDIMINYINNKALTSYSNGIPGFSIINSELKKNFCTRDANNNITSNLYNVDTNSYTIDFLMNGDSLDSTKLNEHAAALGIPIMLIDVSANDSWTFDQFSQQQSYTSDHDFPSAEHVRIQYWDPTGNNTNVITLPDTTVGMQGHSTLADFAKNLNITIPTGTYFTPIKEWFGEQTYTLKADVVDSSHSNNAAIGKFINEVYGLDNNGTSYLPFDQKAIDNVYGTTETKNTTFRALQQPDVTLKHTVTGFPILLIMKFKTSDTSPVSLTPLGIYSFNLGRDAIRNLGFKKVTSIKDADGNLIKIDSFPFVATNITINEDSDESGGVWIEIEDTSTMSLNGLTDHLPAGFDSSLGDFWQNDDAILDTRYSVQYGSLSSVSKYTSFKTFMANVMMMPIEGCLTTNNQKIINRPEIDGDYDAYTYNAVDASYVKLSTPHHMSKIKNDFPVDLGFVFESFYKYFTIGLFHGLIDNFGKNSTYRAWNHGTTANPQYGDFIIDFYDLDTAHGDDNQGLLTIGPDTYIKYLYNQPVEGKPYGYLSETYDSSKALNTNSESIVSANQNKLWLSLDTDLAVHDLANLPSSVQSAYAYYWNDLRTFLQQKASAAGYTYDSNNPSITVVDWFMDKYFIPQTGQCGPLLFNLDYKLKYLLQYTNNSYSETKALTKLHGRKLAYTRDWLTKHIKFLDSLFYWKDTDQPDYYNDSTTMGSNTVLATPDSFMVETNTPLIVFNQIGDNTKTFYFMQQNSPTLINAGNNSGSTLNWNISNSPSIIKLGDGVIYKLSNMNIQVLSYSQNNASIGYNGYPSITDLNLSQNNAFSSFNLDAFKKGAISEIRSLDFSNTSGQAFPLDLIYNDNVANTYFQKLISLDVSGSKCITDLTIPSVPLKDLKVSNSSITKFQLLNQAYLSNIDLTGCYSIQSVDIENCPAYTEVNLQSYPALSTVNISNNSGITKITVNRCNNLTKCIIQYCSSLEEINITNCTGLVGSTNMSITNCPNLKRINFSGCTKLTSFYISQSNQSNITDFNIWNTKVTNIQGDNVDTTLLDLFGYTSLINLNTGYDSAITEIQLPNISGSPVPLSNNFQNCTKLSRIYGHWKPGTTSMFYLDTLFSIHGSNLATVTFNSASVLDGQRVKMPYEVQGQNINNYVPVFQGNNTTRKVTNVSFPSDISSDFNETACTTFDIYYTFSCGSSIIYAASAFRRLAVNPFYWTSTVDNSPNRYMFKWSTNLKSLGGCFWGEPSTSDKPAYIRIFTPDTDANGKITADNGLFSPLVNTIQDIRTIFYGNYVYITNRFIFRHSTSKYNSLANISYFNPWVFKSDSNTMGYMNTSQLNSEIVSQVNPVKYGDFTSLFDDIPNIRTAGSIFNCSYINYDTIINIPLTHIIGSFTSTYGTGTINLQNIFKYIGSVTRIRSCFRCKSSYTVGSTTVQVNIPLTDSFFSGMTSLQYCDYNADGEYVGIQNTGNNSFCGDGIHKTINQSTFPFNIFAPIKSSIISITGIFRDCNKGLLTGVPALPGALFSGCSKLIDCSCQFLNINFEYTLSGGTVDNAPFKDCPNLYSALYMFAASEGRINYLSGQIPSKLFFHGYSDYSQTFNGLLNTSSPTVTAQSITDTTTNETYTKYTIVKNGVTYYMYNHSGVISWTDASGKIITQAEVLDTVTISFKIARKTIGNLNGCFESCNTSAYVKESNDIEIEDNEDYMPLKYVFTNNTFQQKTVNNYQKTAIWEYDGVHRPSDSTIELWDEGTADQMTSPDIFDVGSFVSRSGTLNFICAPDLLRYCTTNCDIRYLFAYSGHNCPASNIGQGFSHNNYGLKGRIVPYLLYPFYTSTGVDLTNMFYNCKVLSYYSISGAGYMIPKDFFSYCPNVTNLSGAFQGMTFNLDVNLNVFNYINPSKLTNISYIFYNCYYNGTSSSNRRTISGIFSTFTALTNVRTAFAPTYNGSNGSPKLISPYITFSNVFPLGKYTNGNYNSNVNFKEVFAYFDPATVVHESTKTMPDTQNNYKYYGQ